jgi:LEA14-like dessication related protein
MAINKKKGGVALAIGAVVLYLIFKIGNVTNVANNVIVNFVKFKLGGTFINPEFTLTLSATNPTNSRVKVSDLVGEIFLPNQKVGDVYTNAQYDIAPSSIINFDVVILATIGNLLTVINSPEKKLLFFKGSVKVEGLQLPLKFNLF